MSEQLLNNILITKVKDHSTAATSDVDSDIVDMSGWEGAIFFTSFGTAAADNLIKVQQNTANSTSGMADLEGTSLVSGASPSNEDVSVDVYKPRERYLRAKVVRATSSTVESVYCLRYGPRTMPTTTTVSGTQAAELHQSPAEGTA